MSSNTNQQQGETLIPYINFMRKWKACTADQRVEFMSKLPQIFHARGNLAAYLELVLKELLCLMQNSVSLSQDVEALLPSDSVLGLEDTIYESKLVETPDDEESTNQKKDKLPITLIRIPSDLQYHLFHFLNTENLVSVQGVCRALCLAARNPLSLHSLSINHRTSRHWPLLQEWLSRPNVLSIQTGKYLVGIPKIMFIGNPKWGQHVTELYLRVHREHDAGDELQMTPFRNLKKCELSCSSNNGNVIGNLIASYSTLEELSITSYDYELTGDIIDTICRFQNLRTLSLKVEFREETCYDSDTMIPITFPKLDQLSLRIRNIGAFRLFLRILIGSHIERVGIDSCLQCNNRPLALPQAAVAAICNVKSFTVTEEQELDSSQLLQMLLPLLESAQSISRDRLIFEKAQFILNCWVEEYGVSGLNDIITMFQYAKQRQLKLSYMMIGDPPIGEMDEMVKGICNAPYGTFTEIELEIAALLTQTERPGSNRPHITDAILSMDEVQCIEKFITKSCDEADKWFESSLARMNEERMRAIGLNKIHFNLEYMMDWDRLEWDPNDLDEIEEAKLEAFESRLKIEAPKLLVDRMELWCADHPRFTITCADNDASYTMSLILKF